MLAWGKTMKSHKTLKVLANAMNKMMQHQCLSTELCRTYELDPRNNYHVMALRELIRTAYDIECGARDEDKEYPNVTVPVENRQVQKEGCSPGLEKGTWWAGGRAFRSLENTGISIATLYHFWQHLGQAVEVCSTGEASSRGGQVAPGEVAPVVAALVQTGNNKIAAYGAAVQRCMGIVQGAEGNC